MKGFASGVGGVCVCMLAIMGTVLCGFALGVEENVGTTTQYNQVADTTGLFETSTLPAFTDYNPAANWTGYRANEGDTALGGVTYTASTKVNGYPVPSGMQYLTSKTFNTRTTELPQANPPGGNGLGGISGLLINKSQFLDTITYMTDYIRDPRVTTVADFLEVFQPTLSGVYAEWEEMVIQFQTTDSDTVNGACAPISNWYYNWIAWRYAENRQKVAYTPYDALLQCYYIKIVSATQTVTGYDSAGNQLWQCPAAAAGLVYAQVDEGSYPVTTTAGDVKDIGSIFKIGLYNTAPTEYMDITQGVIPIVNQTSGSSTWGDPETYWSNGYQNGRISILFKWQGFDLKYSMEAEYELKLSITQKTSDGGEFVRTLEIPIMVQYWYSEKDSSGGSPSLEIFIGSGASQVTFLMGTGEGFILTVDLMQDIISAQIVQNIRTFQDYDIRGEPRTVSGYVAKELGLESIASGQIACDGWNITMWKGTDTDGSFLGQKLAPIMGVIDTAVYMGDTTLVMADATIQPMQLWPNMGKDWEIRFGSFAIIGDALKVYNDASVFSATMPCKDGKITVDGTEHELRNIAIRGVWQHDDNGYWWAMYIVFYDEPTTDPVFLYRDGYHAKINIEFEGYWYFTSAFYASEQVATSTYEVDFQHYIFDSNASILCYMGLLILGTIVAKRMGGLGIYDMIVLIFAGVCGFVLMG